ncbi:MAG TPA: DUF167 domain-containing protein [Desulfomonilaceae bacterium]|nr:DUF167 domain-containing protein [Desulfomonilaceae bacterium]
MYLEEREDGVIIKVKVTPNSSKNALTQPVGDRLGIKLTSPPVEGKANKQLIKFLAKKLGVPPSSIMVLHGQTSREKVLFVMGMDRADVREKIEGDPHC